MTLSGTGSIIPVHEDIYSPYYLNHSDEYKNSGVITPPLAVDGTNYHRWARFFTISMRALNKIGFLDGTIPAPDSTDKKYPCWMMCDELVLWWIIQSVAVKLRSNLLYCKTAGEAWEKLRDRYSRPDNFRIYYLLKDIRSCSQGPLSVAEYFTQLNGLWEELYSCRPIPVCTCICQAGVEMARRFDNDKVFRFLMGLNDTYEDVRQAIIRMSPIPTLHVAYNMVVQQETQRQWRSRTTINTPITASSAAQVTCEHCKRLTTIGSNNFAANQVKMNSTVETSASVRALAGLNLIPSNIQPQVGKAYQTARKT